MAVEVIRKLIGGVWRTVAEDAGGNGGAQTFLTVTKTLNVAEIRALGTTQFPLVDPTEILNYSIEPTSLPYPVMCNGWLLNPNGVIFGNLADGVPLFDLCWGSDYSANVGRAVEWLGTSEPPVMANYAAGVFDGASWNVSFVLAPNPFGGADFKDNGLYVSLNFNGNLGDLTGGDADTTLTLTTIYYISERPV